MIALICVMLAIPTALAAKFVFWDCERAQAFCRAKRETHGPYHAHDGRPCYGDCLQREEAA
jgi:hypothetical protein